MPTKNTINLETQILFRDATDFPNSGSGPPTTAANSLIRGTPTEVQIDLTGVLDSEYREAVKVDLADANGDLFDEYMISAAIEFGATPTAGEAVYFYACYSHSATAGTGNAGGATGADADYTGYPTTGTADDSIKQCQLIGVMTTEDMPTATGTQIQVNCGRFRPLARYLCLVVRNESGATLHTVMDETHIVIDPVTSEAQTA